MFSMIAFSKIAYLRVCYIFLIGKTKSKNKTKEYRTKAKGEQPNHRTKLPTANKQSKSFPLLTEVIFCLNAIIIIVQNILDIGLMTKVFFLPCSKISFIIT